MLKCKDPGASFPQGLFGQLGVLKSDISKVFGAADILGQGKAISGFDLIM